MIFFSWWFTAMIIVAGFFIFQRFVEGMLYAFVVDALYSAPRMLFGDFTFVFSVAAIVFFIFSDIMKSRLRFY